MSRLAAMPGLTSLAFGFVWVSVCVSDIMACPFSTCKCRFQLLAAACCDAGFMVMSSQRMCTAGTG